MVYDTLNHFLCITVKWPFSTEVIILGNFGYFIG